jgi:hypothetical protein
VLKLKNVIDCLASISHGLNMANANPTKLETEAMTLFQVKTADAVRNCLWVLGLRQACGRCGGSGHYSRNSMGDTRCYDCKGRKERAAKLTKAVLGQARAKVATGELEACRERARTLKAARLAIKARLEAEKAAAQYICDVWTAEDQAQRPAEREAGVSLYVSGPLSRARGMSIAVSRVAFEASLAVEFHGANPVRALAVIDDCIAMQRELDASWRAWEAAQRTAFRSAAAARLAA